MVKVTCLYDFWTGAVVFFSSSFFHFLAESKLYTLADIYYISGSQGGRGHSPGGARVGYRMGGKKT